MEYRLFFFLVGCNLPKRFTEQHDVFFGIGQTVADLIPALQDFWPEGKKLHIDAWREVKNVNGHKINVVLKEEFANTENDLSLYFLNLGGYKKGELEEFHFKDIVAAASQEEAVNLTKKTPFYREYGFKGAVAHVDNKYGIDVDEIYPIEEILSDADKARYRIIVTNLIAYKPDEIRLGYMPLSKLKQG